MATPPNTVNYVLSQANVHFTPTGGSQFHMGNCTRFIYSPVVDKLEHFSRMAPLRVKDKTVIRQISATIQLTLEEVVEENLALFFQSDPNTTGVHAMTDLNQEGVLTLAGTNSVGNQLNFTGKVSFSPAGDFDFLKEDWTEILLNADVLIDQGSYGVITVDPGVTA
jgi:hypothetical protein